MKAFFIRRFFRLYPLYVAALSLYAGLQLLQGRPLEYIAIHFLFLQTLESRDIAFHFNPAFWSLPVEVEFYLMLPFLAKFTQGIRSLFLLLICSVIIHLAISFQLQFDQTQLRILCISKRTVGCI